VSFERQAAFLFIEIWYSNSKFSYLLLPFFQGENAACCPVTEGPDGIIFLPGRGILLLLFCAACGKMPALLKSL